MNMVMRGTLARQGLPQGYGDHKRMVAWVSQVSNRLTPSYNCHGPPFIDQGVTTMANWSLDTDMIANSVIKPNSAG